MLSCQPHESSQQDSHKELGICELYYRRGIGVKCFSGIEAQKG